MRFLCGATEVLKPERWVFKSGGGVHLSRQQLPLKLAWAISIHKSQVSSRKIRPTVCVHVIEAVLVTPVLSHLVNRLDVKSCGGVTQLMGHLSSSV